MSHLSVPIVGLAVAVFVLIFLVLRTKVHPLIAMIMAACIAGLTGGMSVSETLDAITKGFGATLGTIGIIIGLGVMMGRILEVSGAAEQIAYSFIKWLGNRKEEWALAMTGYFVSIPIFADSAFVILFPIAKALSKKGNRSLLTLGVALAGGLVVTHTMVPPTPGPLGVAGLFNVDVGAMMLLGMLLAIPCTITFILYGQWLGKKYVDFSDEILTDETLKTIHDTYLSEKADRPLPTLTLSLLPIVVPILLIIIKAMITLLPPPATSELSVLQLLVEVIMFVGTPIIALCISTLLAVYTLVPYLDRHQSSARLEEGLQSAGIILMVTGAGGALGFVVRETGTGTQLAALIAKLPFSPIMIPFLVATVIRLIQGSGTVAMITSASITAPILMQVPGMNMLFAAQAAVIGSFFFSYFNDSLFWVVNRMMGITDVNQQIMTWSIPTSLTWAVGGILIALINLAFGSGGSLLDPLIPLAGLGIIFLVIRRQ
ncbi:GntP family permease [Spirosoma endbachense]|uniref:GntP family permease n=1 Tax=Spirosoma endbachense TaxID=2666025 RepID=A0A6P1W0W3_9BACT|nr:SLC13 family permease [Spirosoma endbachense]QHV99033.1 GntP family permease [Spirosoma endbachense]